MPKHTSPKVKALMLRFSTDNAKKVNTKTIKSMRYIMRHWPHPCVSVRSTSFKDADLPKVIGLTGGKHLYAKDVFDATIRLITMGSPNRPDLQYSVQTFLKAIRLWIPNGILINQDWANAKNRKTDEETLKAMEEFEEWVEDYYHSVESELAGLYLNAGDRNGAQYFKVLERRFRANWSQSFQVNSKSEVKADVKADVKSKVDATVNFNFSVAESNRVPPVGG